MPLAAYATLDGDQLHIRAAWGDAEAAQVQLVTAETSGTVSTLEQADALGVQVAQALIAKGESKVSAILDVLREDIKTCKPIHFDGNGYSDEWKEEAARRGLDCETSCPVIFDQIGRAHV